jgi:DNA-binding response OmpR family regulator
MRELLARVSAQLRRIDMMRASESGEPSETIRAGGIEIDRGSRSVKIEGRSLDLRPREFDLLAFLASRPGRVYSRDQLLQEVWGFDYIGDTRTVDVHIRWLRMKIEDEPSRPRLLQTVRGVGYRFSA